MSQKFAAFDIDGTLYRDGLFHDVVWELIYTGVLPEEAKNEFNEQYQAWKTRQNSNSFNDFVEAHVAYFEKRLPELKLDQYLTAIDGLFERKKDYVYTFTRDLIQQLKADGYFMLAISGSQIEIVEKFAKYYGFDDWVGQIHERVDDKFTGKSQKTYKDKDKFLREMIEKHDLTTDNSFATGDSIGDAGMLEMVEHPIAFNPEESLAKHAKEKCWKIVVERKNVIYELEFKDGDYLLASPGN